MLGRVRGCRAVAGDACGRSSRKARRRRKILVRQAACVAECDTVRNLIYMIGDGRGWPCDDVADRRGVRQSRLVHAGRERGAHQELFAEQQGDDSAAAGTALATGHKTNNSMLGVLPDSTAVESMMAKAVRRGMATGLVVTCYLPHATPGAFYAHQVYRRTLEPIAEQLVESGVDVAFGGGKRYFTARRADGTTLVDRLRTKGYRVTTPLRPPIRSRRARSSGCSHPSTCLMHTRGAGDYLPAPSGRCWRFCRTTLRSGTKASCSWSRGR